MESARTSAIRGLKGIRCARIRLLLLASILGCAHSGLASESRTTLSVTAVVQPVATLHEVSRPATVEISSLDVERGYAVIQPVRLEVSGNTRNGYTLELTPTSPLFTSVVVDGFEGDVNLGAEGGTVVQRWRGTRAAALDLRFKFFLRADLAPGRYPWPLLMTARPLTGAQ